MEDKELLNKYRSTKDQRYISQLYKQYMHLVFGSCMKYLKDVGDAEDAVMDIYEKLVIKTLTSDVKYFKSWLFTVTRNHCLERLRKESTHADKKSAAELMHYDAVFHPDTVDKDNEVDMLHRCIERLGEEQKACVNQFYFKRMSYVEIAGALKITIGQVRSRIQNGRRNIKNCMQSENKLDN